MNKELVINLLKYPISGKARSFIKNYKEQQCAKKFKLIMTIVCRNEEDIIEQSIRFHCAMGVDGVIVTSHKSTDKTNEILENLKQEGLVLEILYKETPKHQHYLWVNEMIKIAKNKYKADWTIDADADEFYYSHFLDLKKSIYEYSKNGINALWVDSTFCFPQDDINFTDNIYFERLNYINAEKPDEYPQVKCLKSIHNTKDFISSTDGNHFVEMKNQKQVFCANITLYHYMIRDYKSWEAKVLRWIDSAQYLKKHQIGHIQPMIDLYKEGKLKEEYNRLYNNNIRDDKLNNGYLYIDKNISIFMKHKELTK